MPLRATEEQFPLLVLVVAHMRQCVRRRGRGGGARIGDEGRDRGSSWGFQFTRELEAIAAAEGRGAAPQVVVSDRVPNVGANAELVVVNPAWMERVSREICGGRALCRRDLVRGIAAHEWSHVVEARDPSRRGRSPQQRELDADRHAGRVLARSGGSSEPLRALLDQGSRAATATHPASSERVEAVAAGESESSNGCRGTGRCTCGD